MSVPGTTARTGTLQRMDNESIVLETDAADTADDELVDELLIEEISIDGMCGVY